MFSTIETVVYVLVLIDALFAAGSAWLGYGERINRRYIIFARYFPLTRGWTTCYLLLVLWLGSVFLRAGMF
jgi:hypothetical protein